MNTQSQSATTPTVFQFQESTQLRVITIDSDPWFVAVDVCAALELGNVTKALLRLDEDEKQVVDFSALNSIQGAKNNNLGNSETNVINESGLYSLILGSRKPEAKKFKKWVTSEVLPAIRKTGTYTVPTTNAAELITRSDEQNIKSVIWNISNPMHRSSSWIQGVWSAVRTRTGVPSPFRFEPKKHLPLIADELKRILTAAEKYRDYTRKLEADVLKTVIRGGGDIDALLAREQVTYNARLKELTDTINGTLSGWELRKLSAITNRENQHLRDLSDLEEI